jgi:hypothetical protein
MQSVVNQLQQLDYNNDDGGVSYVVNAAAVAMQMIGKHVPAATNTTQAIGLLLETVFYWVRT